MDHTCKNAAPQAGNNGIKPIIVGLDLASKVIQATWVELDGTCRDKAFKPDELALFIEEHSGGAAIFGMEACSGSNWWGNYILSRKCEAIVIPAGACRSLNRGMKNDRNDARGVRMSVIEYKEYGERATFHPCKIRPLENQLDQDILKCWIRRCGRLEAIKRELAAMLREKQPMYGHSYSESPQDVACAAIRYASALSPELPNAADFKQAVAGECAEMAMLMREINETLSTFFANYAARFPDTCLKIQNTVRGAGPILSAAVCIKAGNDFSQFRSARAFAAYNGAVPSHHGTGVRNKVGRMSWKGAPYVKGLAFEGALARLVPGGKLCMRGGKWDKRRVVKEMNLLLREIYCVASGKADENPDLLRGGDLRKSSPRGLSKLRSKARRCARRVLKAVRDPIVREQLKETLLGHAGGLKESRRPEQYMITSCDEEFLSPVLAESAAGLLAWLMPGEARGCGGQNG